MVNWKTTVFGCLAAVGVYLSAQTGLPDWLHTLAVMLAALGTGGVGVVARDSGVSDEQSGAGKK